MSGGGSSGGSTSGKVDYPDFMEAFLGDILNHDATDAPTSSFVDLYNTALSANPFTAAAAFDPATALSDMDNAVAAFNTIVDALNNQTDLSSALEAAKAAVDIYTINHATMDDTFIATMEATITAFNALVDSLSNEADFSDALSAAETAVDAFIDDTHIDADVSAFADVQDDQLVNKVIPTFEGGMRDINAVMSSSFALGKAVIYGMRDRDVAKYSSELRMKMNLQRDELIVRVATGMVESLMKRVDFEKSVAGLSVEASKIRSVYHNAYYELITKVATVMVQSLLKRADLEGNVAHMTAEANRIRIVATKEQNDQDLSIDEKDALWDLDLIQYGSNLLASIGGGTAVRGGKEPSQVRSAIGGALSGAAAGAMIGSAVPGIGTGAGAVAGGVAGLISGFL